MLATATYQHTSQKLDLLLDREWARIQTKTFSKWVNSKLSSRPQVPEVENLSQDLHDGTRLVHLLEIIGNENLGKVYSNPKMRIHKVENVNKALDFIQSRGVQLVNIGAPEIVDENEKLILGLLWSIILRFSIADISEEGFKAKEGLLLWCQRKTKGYNNVDVQDFTYSWQDGLAFCALIHKHRPDLLDFDRLQKDNRLENLNLAFDIASKHLGIAPLLDAEDLANISKPDERSVMTYVASYFHAFSNIDKASTAGRRVGKFASTSHSVWEMQHDYEIRASRLIAEIHGILNDWSELNFNGTYVDAKQKFTDFHGYKAGLRRTWMAEKQDLYTLFNNIQTKLVVYHMQPYIPSQDGLAPRDIENQWKALVQAENAKKKEIAERLSTIRTALRRSFADIANTLQTSINEVAQKTASLSGELESQLKTVDSLSSFLVSLQRQLDDLRDQDRLCVEANIEDNELTSYTFDDIAYEYSLLREILRKKSTFLENQVSARKQQGRLSPQQLEEFEHSFRFFDRENANSLDLEQFKDCLQSVGRDYEDQEVENLYYRVGANQRVSFDKFLDYMTSVTVDRATPAQVDEAFRQLANGKAYITEEDMKAGQLKKDEIEYLTRVMPRFSGEESSFDYQSFLSQQFVE